MSAENKVESQEFQKKFEALAKEQDLPSYAELDKEFDLDAIDDGKHVLREVAKRIAEKHDVYARFLEGLLHPENTIASMHESNAFTDTEREQMIVLLKKLMRTFRFYSLCEVDGNGYAEFMQETWKKWFAVKQEMRFFVQKVHDAWLKDETIQADFGYLG